jgi:hypothetical protein
MKLDRFLSDLLQLIISQLSRHGTPLEFTASKESNTMDLPVVKRGRRVRQPHRHLSDGCLEEYGILSFLQPYRLLLLLLSLLLFN